MPLMGFEEGLAGLDKKIRGEAKLIGRGLGCGVRVRISIGHSL